MKDQAKIENLILKIRPDVANLSKKDLPSQLLIRHASLLEVKMKSVIDYLGTAFNN